MQQFLFLGPRVKGNNSLGNAEAAPSSLQLALNPSYFRTNNPISWFMTLMFRSLEPFGIQSRHFVPSLSSAPTPHEREAELISHSQGTLSCSLLFVVAVALMTLYMLRGLFHSITLIKVQELPKLSSTSRQAVWGLMSSWISHPNSAVTAGLERASQSPCEQQDCRAFLCAGVEKQPEWKASAKYKLI